MLCCRVRVVLLLFTTTSLITLTPPEASPVKGHIGHLGFPHLLKPDLLAEEAALVLILLGSGGSLALHSISFIFFPLLFTTLGALGNTFLILLSISNMLW